MGQDKPEQRRQGRAADLARRVVSGVGAAAAYGFGGYATVTTDNELGTVAAFLTGVFFSVVTLTGRVPRIRHGDWEIDPLSVARVVTNEAREAAREAVEKGAEPREVAEAVADAGGVTLDTLQALVSENAFIKWQAARQIDDTVRLARTLRNEALHREIFTGNKSHRLDSPSGDAGRAAHQSPSGHEPDGQSDGRDDG